ncbi:mRNA-binding ribosome synthesis protein nop7 [Lecanora helva]
MSNNRQGKSGAARNYISRTGAVRKLQISLPDFRRLCIFKGIYPREPRSKKRVSKSSTPSTTFYYARDIQYLLHEPLLAKFRDHKALGKKIARHLGRGETGDAAKLEKKGSAKLSLDHIVKERYPTFVDALRDLDDALSLLFLFADLPSTSTVPPKTIALCQRLCREFEHYLITTNSLRKSFLSIKGIYYQATIQGQDILWLVPYKFVQRLDMNVDFRIMGTFVEFYTTLLGFVNFRLYTTIGLIYPPKFDVKSDEKGGELGAFKLEGRTLGEQPHIEAARDEHVEGQQEINGEVQKQITANGDSPHVEHEPKSDNETEDLNDTLDKFEPIAKDGDVLPQPQASSNDIATLFSPFTFFLSRETPRHSLEFILRAFGCKRVGWDASLGDGACTNDESDPTITHQVVDRPPHPDAMRVPGRIYVQPQWVWDCINGVKLLRPDLYAPGATLPAHLSPWVKPSKGVYDPTAPLAEQEREGEAEEAEELEHGQDEDEDEDLDVEGPEQNGASTANLSTTEDDVLNDHGMTVADDDADSSDTSSAAASSFAGFEANDPPTTTTADVSDSENETPLHQRELEAEARGLAFQPPSTTSTSTAKIANGTPIKGILKAGDEARKKMAKKRREEEEELERQRGMMPRRKRKLLDKMLYSNRVKEEESERLRGKRRRIEKGRVGGPKM